MKIFGKLKIAGLILWLCTLLVGCSSDIANVAREDAWTPVYIKGAEDAPTPSGNEIAYIKFGCDGKMNGMSGDNLFGGEYSISRDGNFTTDRVYSTRRAGPYFKYEGAFLNAINQAKSIRDVGDGELELCGKNGVILMRLKKTYIKGE